MGSTIIYGATRASIIEELTRGWSDPKTGAGSRTLKHCARGNVLYAVHENTRKDGDRYRFIGVHMLLRDGRSWGYKSMSEDMGPFYHNCPVSYIELAEEMPLPEGMGKYSIKWRAEVRRLAALRSRKYAVGQVVESTRPLRYNGGEVSRFKIHKLPRGGRSLYCRDADGNVDGLLRLQKTDVSHIVPTDRRAAVSATKAVS